MAGQTLGTADVILKEVYEKKVVRLLNDEVPLVQEIDRSSDGVEQRRNAMGGKYVKFPLHIMRNTGIGARKEMEDLPTPGNQGYITGQENLRYLYGSILVSGQVVRLADSDPNTFIDVVEDETDRLPIDLAVDLNRQLYNDGTGKLGLTTTVGAGTTATLSPITDARNFQLGEYVDVFTAANFASNVAGTPAAAKASVYVTDVDQTTGVVTVSASVTFAANDVFTRNGSVAREVYGLAALIGNSGTVHGIVSGSQKLWQSIVSSNAGTPRPISEGLITTNVHQAKINGSKINLLLFGLGVSRSYQNLLSSIRQVVNSQEAKGGTSGISFTTTDGSIKMREDWTAPPGTLYGLNTKELTFYDDGDWSWWNEDGSMWARYMGSNGVNKDAKYATMFRYLQLVTHKRNAHFVIKDLVEG